MKTARTVLIQPIRIRPPYHTSKTSGRNDPRRSFHEKTNGDFREGNFRIINVRDLNCTMIDFGIGSPQAALIVNCLAYLDNLKSLIMLGMCWGIDDTLEAGDFVIPSAAIRGEGTSRLYLPAEFPAIPAQSVNLFCLGAVKKMSLVRTCGIPMSKGACSANGRAAGTRSTLPQVFQKHQVVHGQRAGKSITRKDLRRTKVGKLQIRMIKHP
jgi:nucleoside phosphorylase